MDFRIVYFEKNPQYILFNIQNDIIINHSNKYDELPEQLMSVTL